ncbi:unnamed protein product [Heterobilharzia americana]|nr:unnamed protein product [Heterobilharzia americana]
MLHLNGIWGLSNLLHTADSSVCMQLFCELVNKGIWLELLQLASTIPNLEFNYSCYMKDQWKENAKTNTNFDENSVVNKIQLPGITVSHEDSEIKCDELSQTNEEKDDDSKQKYRTNLNLFNCSKTHHYYHSHHTHHYDQHQFPLCNPYSKFTLFRKNGAQIHILIVYQTLSFLRNLLRDEKVIDTVVNEHWWNIIQFIVAVLESNYPQPVKEQAVLVVAHIATGRTARCEVHRNGDLVEKLTLFMRSQNSYTKAAALTATYNLLGLHTECLDSCGLLSALKVKRKPFILSHSRRLRVQHYRHETHHGKKQDIASQSTSLIPSSISRREAPTCMAQSALEEAEEENEEQETVVEHCSYAGETMSEEAPVIPQTTDAAISFSIEDDNVDQTRLRTLRRRRYYRSSQPSSPPASDDRRLLDITGQERQLTEPSTGTTRSPSPNSRSPSSSLSTSSTSSCAEGETSVATELTNLHHSVAVDMCGISSPSCTDEDIEDINQHPGTLSSLSPSLTISDRAPLADEERDEDRVSATEVQNSAIGDSDLLSPMSSSSQKCELGSNPDDVSSAECFELNSSEQMDSIQNVSDSNENVPSTSSSSRRDWEAGFCRILLPFLQELDSDQVLRSTWDWLMLCANKDGKPVFLNSLFHAWQRLYTNIPSLTETQTSNLERSESSAPDNNSNNITVNEFLSKIKESIETSSSNSVLTNLPRYWENRHRHRCRRQHRHHCHRRHRISLNQLLQSIQISQIHQCLHQHLMKTLNKLVKQTQNKFTLVVSHTHANHDPCNSCHHPYHSY